MTQNTLTIKISAISERNVREEVDANKESGRRLYEIGIDRRKIAKLQGIPEPMMDWLLRLPERLEFKEPITLVVGENGSGKTSLARAIS